MLTGLGEALRAFHEDLRRIKRNVDVALMMFSEFGRRVKENGSSGTDHGVAGPMFVAGEAVKGVLYGMHPSLTKLDDGDLIHTTHFRSVNSTMIKTRFAEDETPVLGAKYPLLPILRA